MLFKLVLILILFWSPLINCRFELDNPGIPGDKSYFETELLKCALGQLYICRLLYSAPNQISYDSSLLFKSNVFTRYTPVASVASLSYAITPGLPNGLTLDKSTGILSGTYNSFLGTSSTYIISASNSFGSVETSVQVICYGLEPLKTGQVTCLDNLGSSISCSGTGQDAEYQKGSNPSLTDNLDGTIKDNQTGLTWKRCELGGVYDLGFNLCTSAGTISNYPSAVTNCAATSGFRLPTIFEFRSISKMDNVTGFFSPFSIEGFNYWTSNSSPTGHFVALNTNINFAESLDANGNIAKCVSGNTVNSKNSFVDNLDGTIQDIGSGLLWQKCPLGQSYTSNTCTGAMTKITWDLALTSCTSSGLKGKSWRMANINELASLFDSGFSNYINPTFFPTVGDTAGTYGFWSSTGITTSSRVVFFSATPPNLSAAPKSTNNAYATLCVSGP